MPIDIASGRVELDREEFSIPGRVPIRWTRSYRSHLVDEAAGPLGKGWISSWFPSLTRMGTDWRFTARDGSINLFPDVANEVLTGNVVRLLGAFMEIRERGGNVCVTQWNVESGEIETFVFRQAVINNQLELVAIENVSGDSVELRWSSTGQLQSLHQSLEHRTILARYTPEGLIAALWLDGDESNPLVLYEYDADGHLLSSVNQRGFAHRYEYDDQSRLKRELLPDGAVYTYKYDDRGRCIHFTGLDRYNEKKLRFLEPVNTTILTNSYGAIKTFQCNACGQIEVEIGPTGGKRETKYDEFDRVVERIDELGASTKYTYDESGNRDSITDALGNVTKFSFNQFHLATSMIDATGHLWKREYTRDLRLAATENPLGARWSFGYDLEGNLVEVIEPQGNKRLQRFERGLLRYSSDFMAHEVEFSWDMYGRLVSRTGAVGETTRFGYDVGGNLIQVDQPDGGTLTATYDGGNNLSTFTNAKGDTIRYRFGSCKRLLERMDAIGRTIRYEWGTEPEHLDAVFNEKGERFSFDRDDAGRVILEQSFDGRKHHFTYDAAGRVAAIVNGMEERIVYERDPVGRLIQQKLSTGEITSFEFDPIGRMLSAVNPDATVKFDYDPAGKLVRESQNEHWIQTEYNLTGEIIRTWSSQDHEVNYALDPNGRVHKLTTDNNQSLEFERDARGLEVGRQMPGESRLEQQFDTMGRLIAQRLGKTRHQFGSMPADGVTDSILPNLELHERNYAYDQDGVLVAINDSQWGMTAYTYDPAERLLSVFRERGTSEFFQYDLTNNLVQSKQENGELLEEKLSYTSGSRIQLRGDTLYEHDREGRLIRKTEKPNSDAPRVWEFFWDAQGRLCKIHRPDSQVWTYKYDAFGRRIEKKGPESKITYIWNRDSLVHELSDDDHLVSWLYVSDSFVVLGKITNGVLLSIVSDHLSTPIQMIDGQGEVVWSASHSAWGQLHSPKAINPDNDCSIRFQGQWFDAESGLHYNRFRYFDSATARFISQDPIRLGGGLNLYQYVENPINWVDPFGLAACHDSGDRGRDAAEKDLIAAGHTILAEEVTMVVNNSRIRADFVTQDAAGNIHVVEVKNGSGRLTPNQSSAGVFNTPAANGSALGGGGINTSGSTTGTMTVATSNPTKTTAAGLPAKGGTQPVTFSRLQYDV